MSAAMVNANVTYLHNIETTSILIDDEDVWFLMDAFLNLFWYIIAILICCICCFSFILLFYKFTAKHRSPQLTVSESFKYSKDVTLNMEHLFNSPTSEGTLCLDTNITAGVKETNHPSCHSFKTCTTESLPLPNPPPPLRQQPQQHPHHHHHHHHHMHPTDGEKQTLNRKHAHMHASSSDSKPKSKTALSKHKQQNATTIHEYHQAQHDVDETDESDSDTSSSSSSASSSSPSSSSSASSSPSPTHTVTCTAEHHNSMLLPPQRTLDHLTPSSLLSAASTDTATSATMTFTHHKAPKSASTISGVDSDGIDMEAEADNALLHCELKPIPEQQHESTSSTPPRKITDFNKGDDLVEFEAMMAHDNVDVGVHKRTHSKDVIQKQMAYAEQYMHSQQLQKKRASGKYHSHHHPSQQSESCMDLETGVTDGEDDDEVEEEDQRQLRMRHGQSQQDKRQRTATATTTTDVGTAVSLLSSNSVPGVSMSPAAVDAPMKIHHIMSLNNEPSFLEEEEDAYEETDDEEHDGVGDDGDEEEEDDDETSDTSVDTEQNTILSMMKKRSMLSPVITVNSVFSYNANQYFEKTYQLSSAISSVTMESETN